MTLAKRIINLTLTLGKGAFGADGFDTVELTGRRVSAHIARGGAGMAEAEIRAYGVPRDIMNSLTILGVFADRGGVRLQNTVTVSAGDTDSGVAVVFRGGMTECWVDASDAPNVCLVMMAYSGAVDALKPIPATSYNGSVDVATIIAGLAAQMSPPRSLENNGVSVVLSNSYFPGTALDQIRAIARHAHINFTVDDTHASVAIWPIKGSRTGDVPLISATTGMVGYPTHTQSGISVSTLFNPGISFGGQIDVESVFTSANGRWIVYTVDHEIASETPGGPWFTHITTNVGDRPQ